MAMPDTTGRERRKYVRVSANFMVKVKCRDAVISYPAAFARNISSGGVGIEIGGRYPDSFEILTHSSDPVSVEITLPSGEVLNVGAQVVWGHVDGGKTDEGQSFRVGLKFIDLDEQTKQKLGAFIKEKVNEALTQHARARVQRKTPPPSPS